KEFGGIESIRLVCPLGHDRWREWRAGAARSNAEYDEWPAPARKGLTVKFDPENKESGYITVAPASLKASLMLDALAPTLWTALLLQAALNRVQKASVSETELVRATLRARDAERQRIARDLHDDLGQSMASLKLNLKWAEDIARKKDL